jgi:hypothetical protein
LEEEKIEMAIKVFLPVVSEEGEIEINRDLQHGLDSRLGSEYTVMYKDCFEAQGFQCVSMPLMKSSLRDYLKDNKMLSDDVYIYVVNSLFIYQNFTIF